MIRSLSILVPSFLIAGCINISSFETAEVLPEGKDRFHIGLSDYSGTTISSNVKDKARQIWPNVEIGYHRGLGDEWEWASNFTLIGSFATHIKRQLLSEDDFHLAAGTGTSYVYYRSGNGKYFNLYSLDLPLFASYRLNPLFTFYANPQYASRWLLSDDRNLRSDWLGLGIGCLIYEKVAFEASYMRSKVGLDSFQVGLALFLD